MDKKAAFNTAHTRTRIIKAKNPALNYRIVFAFQLKKAIAEQPKKITTLHADKSVTVDYTAKPKLAVNKKVAMIGDYVKPKYERKGAKLIAHDDSRTVTTVYNIGAMMIIFLAVIIIGLLLKIAL